MKMNKDKATLGLAMIIKNEALNLSKSLAPASDLFDEMIVVDTGSEDQSRDIALALGARVVDFTWIHDFSAARNFGLEKANTDFIMWLDADNCVSADSVGEFRRHLKKGAEVILMGTEVVTPQGDRLWQKRVFPNSAQARFEGRIHEQLVHPPHWEVIATGAEILHWGYAEPTSARKKGERNLELLLTCSQTRAGDFYYLYQTGRTLANLRRYDEAIIWLQRSAQAQSSNRSLWAHSLILMSQVQAKLGQYDDAEISARRLVQEEPDYGPGHYNLGKLLYDGSQDQKAAPHLEVALMLGCGDRAWGADEKQYGYRAAFLLGRIWAAQGQTQPARQAFTLARQMDPQSPEPDFALAEVALAEGSTRQACGHLEAVLRLAPGHRRAATLYQKLSTETFHMFQ